MFFDNQPYDFFIDITNYTLWPIYTDAHYHNVYELYFLFHGSTNYTINDTVYQLNAGDIVWIPPHVPHHTRPRDTEQHKRMLFYISDSFLETCKKNTDSINFTSSCHVFHPCRKDTQYFRKLANLLLEDYYSEQPYSHLLNQGIFTAILVSLQRMYDKSLLQNDNMEVFPSNAPNELKILLAFIRKHFEENITLDLLSQQVNLSPSYISSLFKKHLEFTFKEYLLDVRIKSAKELLRTTTKTIEQIALSCGFNSTNHFCKTFKRIVGIQPKTYRNIGSE